MRYTTPDIKYKLADSLTRLLMGNSERSLDDLQHLVKQYQIECQDYDYDPDEPAVYNHDFNRMYQDILKIL